MFDLDPALDRIPVAADAIERVAWSLNLTSVAGMDFAGAEARAYAVIGTAGRGRSVCYVCLYVASLDRVQVFRHQDNPFPTAEGEAHEGEALAFLEDLGFILERVDYRGWSSRKRKAWYDKQPPFHQQEPPPGTRSVPLDSQTTIPTIRKERPSGAPPLEQLPTEMEGLQTLADPIEGPQGAPSSSPREIEQEAPFSSGGAVAPPSPPPLRELDVEPVAPPEISPALEVERFSASGNTSVPGETFGGSLAEPPSNALQEDAEEASEPRAGAVVPEATPIPPAEPEAPLEMEGLIFLNDPEAPPSASLPSTRQAVQGASRSRARTAVRASRPEAVEPEGRAASGRPVKVDLPKEYEDLARLFASL